MKTCDELYAYEILKNTKDIEDETKDLMSHTNMQFPPNVGDFVDIQD